MNTESADDKQTGQQPSGMTSPTDAALNQPTQATASKEDSAERQEVVGFYTPQSEEGKRALDALLRPSDEAQKRARQLLRDGQLEAAEAECRHALTLSPIFAGKRWSMGALALLGEILLAQKRNEEALDCFIQSYEEGPLTVEEKLGAALAYCRLGDFEMAQQFYSNETILRFSVTTKAEDLPGTGDLASLEASILLGRAKHAILQHDYKGASRDLKAAGELAPGNAVIADFAAYVLDRL